MFTVQFTKHLTQKSKVWMDGTLTPSGRKFILCDEEGTTIETAWLRPSDVVVGEEVRTERHLIQIIAKSQETAEPAPAAPAPAATPAAAPRGSVIIPKSSAASKVRRNPLASSLRRTGKSLGARPTIRKPTPPKSTPFVDDSDIADQLAADAAAAAEEAYQAKQAAPSRKPASEARNPSPPDSFRSARAAYAEQQSTAVEKSSSAPSPVAPSGSFSYSSPSPMSCSGECPERLPPPPPGGRSRQSIVAHLENE